jgi:prepilin-type N-terminal cleavage/methylation domain-containing protein
VFKKNKKGYTLIEMMVVMGIMALLAVLGIAAMMGTNDDNITEEAAQSILSAIREAQTKAISVTPDSAAPTPHIGKAWAVELNLDAAGNNNSYRLDNYYLNAGVLTSYPNSAVKTLRSGIRVRVLRYDSTNALTATYSNGQNFVTFATPFARSYITLGSSFVPPSGSGFCTWSQSSRPEQDWGVDVNSQNCGTLVSSSSTVNSISTNYILIEVKFKNKTTRNIRVASNGDAYIQ